MKFSDFIVREAILCGLAARTKEEAIREMVASFVTAGKLGKDESENVVSAILRREELGTTGIGKGVAVPHTKHPSVTHMIGAVAVSKSGLDFAAMDREPVDLFFLLVSPLDRPGDHLRALECITRHLREETFCRFLRQSKETSAIVEVLEEADDNKFA